MTLGRWGASRTRTVLLYANFFLKGGRGKSYDIAILVSHISAYKFAPVNVMKALGEVGSYLYLFLNSVLDEGQ
jgi:hypothetical protein